PLLVLLIVGVVALSHRPHSTPLTDATLRSAPTQVEATATGTPTPKPRTTALPTLTLTLSCRVHNVVAIVSIHNASKVSVTWVATPPSPFIATPETGSLAPDADATPQVTGKNGKSPAGLVISVRATHGSVTTPFSVTCPGGGGG
ncbi:MAG TPA: hypothetical protein VF807_06880, partial [Ktedonobacterales bacterium]